MSDGDATTRHKDATTRHKSDARQPSGANLIFGTVLRLLWAATAFCIAAGVALVVLYVLGALWVGMSFAPRPTRSRAA
jgi:hypothetical protein